MKLSCEPAVDTRQQRDPLACEGSEILFGTNVDVLLERCQILRVNINPDFVEDVSIEQIVRRLRE
jgi:hypothetical protein